MKSLRHLIIFFSLALCILPAKAQKSISDSTISFSSIDLAYGAYLPAGDFADRFGFTNIIGGEFTYKFDNNIYLNTGLKFLFGSEVRERVASNVTIEQEDGNGNSSIVAIGSDGLLKAINFYQRGFVVPFKVGKIFPIIGPNPNSGIYVEAGGQFIQHRVFIEVVGGGVPNLEGDFIKGFDRLTNGFGLAQGLGYRHVSDNRLINFFAGIDINQSFTQNRRSINYDTGMADNSTRLDLLFGFKVGWSFLIYKQAPDKYYIY